MTIYTEENLGYDIGILYTALSSATVAEAERRIIHVRYVRALFFQIDFILASL